MADLEGYGKEFLESLNVEKGVKEEVYMPQQKITPLEKIAMLFGSKSTNMS